MAKKKAKKRKKSRPGQNPTIEKLQTKAETKKPWAAKRAAIATGKWFKSLPPKARQTITEFKENFKAGKKVAEQAEAAAEVIKGRVDKLELMQTVKRLRDEADAIEAIANTM